MWTKLVSGKFGLFCVAIKILILLVLMSFLYSLNDSFKTLSITHMRFNEALVHGNIKQCA